MAIKINLFIDYFVHIACNAMAKMTASPIFNPKAHPKYPLNEAQTIVSLLLIMYLMTFFILCPSLGDISFDDY